MEQVLFLAYGAIGAILASFIGVCVERLNTGESWVKGRSRCNSCNRTLRAYDLVPIASWIISRGRCFVCRARIPSQYALAEVLLGFLFYLSASTMGFTLPLVVWSSALMLLLFVVLYDLRHMVVPLPAAALFVLSALVFAGLTASAVPSFGSVLMIAGISGLVFFLFFLLSQGRLMGLGDSPIVLGLSILVGTASIPGLLFSFWIGGLCGIVILATRPRGHRIGIEVPFVPFLAAGYLLAYFTQWTPFFF